MQMIHVENEFIKPDGSVDWEKAAMDEAGVAVISVLFRVDNMKPQNQRPINVSQFLQIFQKYVKLKCFLLSLFKSLLLRDRKSMMQFGNTTMPTPNIMAKNPWQREWQGDIMADGVGKDPYQLKSKMTWTTTFQCKTWKKA